jgi:N utilization substance protein A
VSGIVQQAPQRPGAPTNRNVMVKLGTAEDALEAVLPPTSRCRGGLRHGSRLKCRIVGIARGQRGASVTVSRTHPTWCAGCSRWRCPRSRTARSRSSRWPARPGHRTKIAVRSTVAGLNPKGACIGPVGSRVRNVTTELHGEKVDIVDWSADPARFVASALSPARVSSVEVVDAVQRSAAVVVPDYQLSLAIGKEGQNARLAAPAHRLAHRHPQRHRGHGSGSDPHRLGTVAPNGADDRT